MLKHLSLQKYKVKNINIINKDKNIQLFINI